jgi:hypothetical protein
MKGGRKVKRGSRPLGQAFQGHLGTLRPILSAYCATVCGASSMYAK